MPLKDTAMRLVTVTNAEILSAATASGCTALRVWRTPSRISRASPARNSRIRSAAASPCLSTARKGKAKYMTPITRTDTAERSQGD
jgi:hypothetical protein